MYTNKQVENKVNISINTNIGKFANELMRMRELGGGDDVIVIHVVHPECDVLPDGAAEEYWLLTHHTWK